MLDVAINVIVSVYTLAMIFILLHSISDAHLIYHYLASDDKKAEAPDQKDFQPYITIQLPLYNELYVVERLMECCRQNQLPKR